MGSLSLLQGTFPMQGLNPGLPSLLVVLYQLSHKGSPSTHTEICIYAHLLIYIGVENDSPLEYSCLENPMDRGAWRATVHGVTKNWTQLSD